MTTYHVFIDESGDLGFTQKSTRYFVTAYLIIRRPDVLRKRMRRFLKRFHERGKYPHGAGELKFSRAGKWVKNKVLEEIIKYDVNIGEIVLKKWKVKTDLKENLNLLYNYVVVHNIMVMILPIVDKGDKLKLNLDKCMPGSQAKAFSDYASRKVSYLWQVRLSRPTPIPRICVTQTRSDDEPCIQAVDFVAGAIFRKHERRDDTYYSILEKSGKISSRILWS